MTQPTRVILDCDPGIDDALAIVFAHASPAIELTAITTVAGNVGLAQTTANALAVASFAGAADVPVAAGSAVPLLRPALDAHDVHGETGLGGAVLPPPGRAPADEHAVDLIVRETAAAPGEITLVAIGPLTNIAMALRRDPDLVGRVRDFVIMGGSSGRGNVTPAAEYNIWADPEAAAIVFGAGWTVTMIGLDVTLLARADAGVQDKMRGLGKLGPGLLLPALEQYTSAPGDPPVHDLCAVAYLARPDLFRLRPAEVKVETAGRWTSGMTVTDFEATVINAQVATDLNVSGFWDMVLKTYENASSLSSRLPRQAAGWPRSGNLSSGFTTRPGLFQILQPARDTICSLRVCSLHVCSLRGARLLDRRLPATLTAASPG